MRLRIPAWGPCLVVAMVVLGGLIDEAYAEHRTTNVPPTLEIEVLDPNADPLGRPAVELVPDEYGNTLVNIPPVVLVHRYYFTGERSFQAQPLPGRTEHRRRQSPQDGRTHLHRRTDAAGRARA